ncbi:MAG: non-hydrolyzing UDP-N-acetylglucosamine 2-epimerase [Candidatus Heimdallarchaeaceae archaeon]
MVSISFVLGTRPEIIKLAPIIHEAQKRELSFNIIHTGQHYDDEMSEQFLKSLNIPSPDINLEVKSSTLHTQLGRMVTKLGNYYNKNKPDIVLAVGDTISVLAAALASTQNNVPFGHIESGLRSYDNTMPEEINRRIADSIATLHFAPSDKAVLNLLNEGIEPQRVFNTGNTIVDAIRVYSLKLSDTNTSQADKILQEVKGEYSICTIHRVSNVENKENLLEIIQALESFRGYLKIFLLHPRTEKKLLKFNLYDQFKQIEGLHIYKSVNYLSMLKLLTNEKCHLIITDSGGLIEEASVLKIPCITIRPNTERPETVEGGVNFLVRPKALEILQTIEIVLSDKDTLKKIDEFTNPYGDGYSSGRILDIIEEILPRVIFQSPESYKFGSKSFYLIDIQIPIKTASLEELYGCTITMVYGTDGEPLPIPEKLEKGYRVRLSLSN